MAFCKSSFKIWTVFYISSHIFQNRLATSTETRKYSKNAHIFYKPKKLLFFLKNNYFINTVFSRDPNEQMCKLNICWKSQKLFVVYNFQG